MKRQALTNLLPIKDRILRFDSLQTVKAVDEIYKSAVPHLLYQIGELTRQYNQIFRKEKIIELPRKKG